MNGYPGTTLQPQASSESADFEEETDDDDFLTLDDDDDAVLNDSIIYYDFNNICELNVGMVGGRSL